MDTTCSRDRRFLPAFTYGLNLLVILAIAIAATGSVHAQEPTSPTGWHDGALGSVNAAGCTAYGWAVDPDDPSRDLDVRILVDGNPVATTTANLLRQDLTACPAGTCGFAVKLWGLMSAGVEHLITAQAYDTETQTWVSLSGTPKSLTCWGLPEGSHDGAEGTADVNSCTAFGWAVDPDNRDLDVSIRVLSDGVEVANDKADDFGQDMSDSGICPGGTCRFTVNLWGVVEQDQEHQITVQAYDPGTDQWWNLEGTPKTLTCSPPPPVLTVSVSNNYLRADNFAPNATVTFTAYASSAPGEAPLWSDSRTMDTNGFAFIWPWEGVPDLVVGNYVVATDGIKEKQLVLEAVTIDSFDPDTDVVTGTAPLAPAGRYVTVWAGDDVSPGCIIWVQPDPLNGAWTADFKTQPCDVRWNMWGAATVYDGDGDATVYEKGPPPNPFMIAFPENDAVEAWEWPDGSAVHLSIDDPSTVASPDYSADGTMAVTTWDDPRTYFRFDFSGQYDLKAGDIVSVTDGQRERSHTVRNLSVTEVSAGADAVAGTADAAAQVEVWPHGFDQTATIRVTAGEDGGWLANFSGLFDIVPGTGGRSQILDEVGNSTAVDWNVPMPWFTAFPEGDQVEGWDWPLGANMVLTIDDPSTGPNPDFSKEGKVELAPWGSGQHWVWFEFRGAYDLKPGDIVTLTDGVTSKTHIVQNLSVTSVNVIENTVSGTANAGTNVSLWAWEDPEGRRLQVTADNSGMWAGDFEDAGYDVRQYNTVRAEVWDDFGNDTAVDRQTDYNYDIYIYDPPTGTVRQLTHSPDTDEYNPSWSPNGKLIAHDVVVRGASQSISITDVKTGISTPLRGAEDGGNDAVWSPNGKWIAFDRYWAGGPNLYVVPATGGDPTVVREDAIGADWAPNGKRLVFQQPSDGSIRTIAVDGGAGSETSIANSGANPVWSPDGNWIAYEHNGDIWKMNVNVQGTTFGDAIQVTSLSAREEEPSWSADSQSIAFQTGLGGDYDIWTVPAAGGEPTWLVGAVEFGDYSPAYAKNGSAVAYASASADGQAARTWVAAYTYDAGTWSEGQHGYHFEAAWNGGSETSKETSFNVVGEAQPYEGYVLLRPGAVRAGVDCPAIDAIRPDQPTRFLAGWTTIHEMNYDEAVAFFDGLSASAIWDDGYSAGLARHEIIPFRSDDWLQYVCTFTSP